MYLNELSLAYNRSKEPVRWASQRHPLQLQVPVLNKRTQSKVTRRNNTSPTQGTLVNFLLMFLETSSIHGLNHLVANKRSPAEK
uniref:Uncharacterized protein n=1 Tax=Timema poppense TaxID=170557 RepID=A0A7R9DJ57_TIMPO|nr:unnamed protein product [Timema poppensis]